MKVEILPPDTLTPSCRDASELAREIGRIVSNAVGTEVTIYSMKLGVGDGNGNDITINWKLGDKK